MNLVESVKQRLRQALLIEVLVDLLGQTALRGKFQAKVVESLVGGLNKRIDALFAIEREINGKNAEDRLAARQEKSKPVFDELETW
jgi:hypothetical protein